MKSTISAACDNSAGTPDSCGVEAGADVWVTCVHAAPAKWELTECFLSWPTWNGFSRCVYARIKFRGCLSGEKMLWGSAMFGRHQRRFWSFSHLEMQTGQAVATSSDSGCACTWTRILQHSWASSLWTPLFPQYRSVLSEQALSTSGGQWGWGGQQRVWWGRIWHHFREVFKHMSSLAHEQVLWRQLDSAVA